MRASLGQDCLFFSGLWEDSARTALGNVKDIKDGFKGFEFFRPGIIPMDLPYDVASVQELKVPSNSTQNLSTVWTIGRFPARDSRQSQ